MEATPRELVIYQTQEGLAPFEVWLNGLRDVQGRAVIRKRLNRVHLGNFGEQQGEIVVLLCGGDKSTQGKDIQKAQEYWSDYLS